MSKKYIFGFYIWTLTSEFFISYLEIHHLNNLIH